MKSLYPTGRKHCSKCGRWRPVSDFGRTTKPHVLQARCKTCERIECRIRNGLARRGKPYEPQKRTTPLPGTEAWKEYRREYGRRWFANLSPEQRERRLEYARIWKHGKARERGVRELARNRDVPVGPNERLTVPVGPFAEWLRENASDGESLRAWTQIHDLDDAHIKRILDGRQQRVHIDLVDRALVAAGRHLIELYPELYDYEMEAA